MMTQQQRIMQASYRRRGSVYIAVLGASLIAVTLAVAGIYSSRIRARAADASGDGAEARLLAQSGVELARAWMNLDPGWRTSRSNGNWVGSLSIGSGTIAVNVVDPLDSDLTNRPHDAVLVTVTAQRGEARRLLQQTFTARPTTMPVLAYAVTSTDVRIRSGYRLAIGNGTLYARGQFRGENDSTLEGNVVCGSSQSDGIVFGTVTNGVSNKGMPDGATIAENYAKLGTLINPGSTITKQVLGPGVNPYGAPNGDGVYVIRTSSSLTIGNSRICGTLVVIAPGQTVTIDTAVLMSPAREDYPTLIVVGNAVFQFNSQNPLSESTLAVNMNPTGAPYQGITDADVADSLPNEIQGLVDITGTLQVTQAATIRGCLICEGSGGGMDIRDTPVWQVIYNPSIYNNPPQWYTTSVKMAAQAGTLKQVVN